MAEKTWTAPEMKGKRLFLAVWKDVRPIRWWLAFGALLSAFGVVLAVFAPDVLGKAVDLINDYILGRGAGAVLDWQKLLLLIMILAVLYLASSLFSACKVMILNNVVSRHFTCGLRIQMSEKLKRMPVSFVDRTQKGEILSRMMNDVSAIGNTVHNFINLMIEGFLQLLAIAVMMFLINWALSLIVLAIVPISLTVAAVITKKSQKHLTELQEQYGELYSVTEETYAGLKTVRAFRMEGARDSLHEQVNGKLRESSRKANYLLNMVQPVISFTNKICFVLICLLGGYFAISGVLSVGAVAAVLLYAKQFSSPIEGITGGLSTLQRSAVSAKRVYELLHSEEMEERDGGGAVTGDGTVVLSGVDFSYRMDQPLIRDLNLAVENGQKVAIVGPTGGGKTTVVNLLMRFYDIDRGKILVDGVDIMTIPRERLRSVFSMVLQDTWLFTGTIAENVAYGKEGATREEVVEACRKAYCDHFIRALPEGYETMINEDATNISGGQKQLLTIARAFLFDRKILILDEATSNVDTRTEVLIQKAMDELMRGKTCFVIAHRLSTIVNADRILVVDNGSVVEQGTHGELLERKGFYYEIFMSQYAINR